MNIISCFQTTSSLRLFNLPWHALKILAEHIRMGGVIRFSTLSKKRNTINIVPVQSYHQEVKEIPAMYFMMFI